MPEPDGPKQRKRQSGSSKRPSTRLQAGGQNSHVRCSSKNREALRNWKRISSINGFSLPTRSALTGSPYAFDPSHWPTLHPVAETVSAWHRANARVHDCYGSLRRDEAAGLPRPEENE
jgi:hypothetical protein